MTVATDEYIVPISMIHIIISAAASGAVEKFSMNNLKNARQSIHITETLVQSNRIFCSRNKTAGAIP